VHSQEPSAHTRSEEQILPRLSQSPLHLPHRGSPRRRRRPRVGRRPERHGKPGRVKVSQLVMDLIVVPACGSWMFEAATRRRALELYPGIRVGGPHSLVPPPGGESLPSSQYSWYQQERALLDGAGDRMLGVVLGSIYLLPRAHMVLRPAAHAQHLSISLHIYSSTNPPYCPHFDLSTVAWGTRRAPRRPVASKTSSRVPGRRVGLIVSAYSL
jgi:hypothetical protein